jgi:GGDEF domain-containing protein
MGEAELVEIESRIEHYPPQARHDILRLTSELRQLAHAGRAAQSPHAGSPLYDAATGLLNAGAYGVRFAMARARATRFRKMFAVMSIEVHATGKSAADYEYVIKEVASRLEGCVRATDTLARAGEGIFEIILEDLTQPGHAERAKQNVQNVLSGPLRLDEREIAIHTDVALRFYPGPSDNTPIKYAS